MIEMKKYSAVSFNAPPQNRKTRNGFEVVLKYREESDGAVLVDLSHRTKWDLQDANLDRIRPWGLEIPASPGSAYFNAGLLMNRMNRTQASIWHLGAETVSSPGEFYFTDITDGQTLLALVGSRVLFLMEKLCHLDLTHPGLKPPFLIQGPVLHIPSQVVLMGEVSETTGVLIAFSRGYGQAVADTILDICKRDGLTPGGEDRFTQWLADRHTSIRDFENG